MTQPELFDALTKLLVKRKELVAEATKAVEPFQAELTKLNAEITKLENEIAGG